MVGQAWCVPITESVDTTRAVRMAIGSLGPDHLTVHSVRVIEEGFIISLVSAEHLVGGGGLVWVDGENGCPIVLRRYE